VNRYIDAYGTGVQHLAIEVDDLEPVMQELRARGADMLTDVIHGPGLDQAFTMREPNTGMQFEFVARTNNADFDEENVRKLFTAMERKDMY
jgi:4-hydroxyphenylpyruvate dioxygenase-like putative hemolysin